MGGEGSEAGVEGEEDGELQPVPLARRNIDLYKQLFRERGFPNIKEGIDDMVKLINKNIFLTDI